MNKTLTFRQKQVLAFVRTWIEEHGYPPTIREVQAGCEFSSTGGAVYQLDQLHKAGSIRRNRAISRGIVLL